MSTYQQQVEWELAGWQAFFAGLKDGDVDNNEDEDEGKRERTDDNENDSNQ